MCQLEGISGNMVRALVFCFVLLSMLSWTAYGGTVFKAQDQLFKNTTKYEDPNHGMEPGKIPRYLLDQEDPVYTWSEDPANPANSPDEPLIDIFPPKWYPGDIYPKTGHSDVDKALNDVMRSGDILHDRRCAIGIANEGESKLTGPKWALKWGGTHAALPLEVETGKTSLNLFLKTKGFLTGTAGVMSYDIGSTGYKVVVMWSVPFDLNLYSIWFNMKVYPKSVATDNSLWSHMYYNGGPFRTAWHDREEFGVKLRAVMTDNTKSKLIVWVNADGFNQNGDYDLYTDCSYHAGWFGKYCNQECFGDGWCWVNKRCSSKNSCAGRHVCYSRC